MSPKTVDVVKLAMLGQNDTSARCTITSAEFPWYATPSKTGTTTHFPGCGPLTQPQLDIGIALAIQWGVILCPGQQKARAHGKQRRNQRGRHPRHPRPAH